MKPRVIKKWGKEQNDLNIWDLVGVDNKGEVVLSDEFYNVIERYFLTQEDLDKGLSEIRTLIKQLQSLKQEKEKRVNEELKGFETEFNVLKDKSLKELQVIIARAETSKKELEKLSEQLIKKLDSAILKKVPSQVKPEDLDTIKVLININNKIAKLKEDESDIKINHEIRETIPKLNLAPKLKFNILQSVGDLNELADLLRKIIDSLQAGLELTDIKTLEKRSKEQERSDYYGD